MINTAVPVSHQGFTVYGGGSTPVGGGASCFMGLIGDTGCPIDKSKWKDWVGVAGTGQIVDDTGQSILWYSKANKDFAIGTDKVSLLMPFIVLMLAFGLAIGWSKGRR